MDAKLIPSNVVEAFGRSGAQEFDELFKRPEVFYNPNSAMNN